MLNFCLLDIVNKISSFSYVMLEILYLNGKIMYDTFQEMTFQAKYFVDFDILLYKIFMQFSENL